MNFFADRSNEGPKSMSLNFTWANWVNLFLQGPQFKLGNFTRTKSTCYHLSYYLLLAFYRCMLLTLNVVNLFADSSFTFLVMVNIVIVFDVFYQFE
jgi:hypothetical protein